MPFANNAPTIKEMLVAVDAGTATVAEATAIVNKRLARAGKGNAWYARYNTLAAKLASGDAVVATDVFPKAAAPAAAPAQGSWDALTKAVLDAAPSATTAQVAAFASKLIRANG